MSIFVNKKTRVLVQGITGHHGSFNTEKMLGAGTKIVAGVTPGKAGQEVCGVPVYNSVKDALKKHKVDWSIMFVPAPFAKNAAIEALSNNLNLVAITEEIPVHDAIAITSYAQKKKRVVIGPNCPGIATAEETILGITPKDVLLKGNVGVVSRSGTLTYEIVSQLTKAGIGQSTILGIGGDRVVGTHYIDVLKRFEKDKQTKVVVMIGEIGGVLEQNAAPYIKKMKTPVVTYITGQSAPPGKRMGHAGAIVYGKGESAAAKIKLLKSVGATVAKTPNAVPRILKKMV